MKRQFFLGAAFVAALLLTGCATRTKMAFENDAETVTEKSKPVYLMTATIRNGYRPTWQPRLLVVHVEKDGAKEVAHRLNFTMDDKAKNETDSETLGNTYLLRMELEPGKYDLRGMSSMASSFPLNGIFFTPLHAPLVSGGPGVFYLGNVTATVRERAGNEFRAGPPIPLLDQAVTGASGGTFDVTISDNFESDEALFRGKFKALAGVTIQKAVLAPFDRSVAQKWWEAN